jgi:adenosylcobinamide-GDP ribazoletransferase
MRDSRIGSFGAVALILTLLARLSALAAMGDQPALVAGALVAAGAASRAAMPVVMHLQPSARASGLAAEAGKPEPARVAAAVLVAVAASFLLLPTPLPRRRSSGRRRWRGRRPAALGRRFGGCTGDTLGAVQQLAEVAFLFGILARL